MEFGKIHVKIRGLPPGVMWNKPNPEDFKKTGPTIRGRKYIPEEIARKKAYITKVDGEEQLYIPNDWLYSMTIKAASEYKEQGRRASLSAKLAGTIRIEPEKILLGHCNYEIDERFGNIKKAKVLIWRPKVKDWEVEFYIVYNKLYINPEIVEKLQKILEDGGIRLGVGDYRPQHKGPFGTFTVVEYEILS